MKRKKMEEYHGVRWASSDELSDLLGRQAVEGPLDPQRIIRKEGIIRSGLAVCYQEAAHMVRERGYDFAFAHNVIETPSHGIVDIEFYRFKRT